MIFSICILLNTQSIFSQISELHLDDLANCIPSKNKDIISSIEQSYKDGVTLYNDANKSELSEQVRIEKLTSLFKIQVITKNKINEIWEQSDSSSRVNSAKYFTEASIAFKGLTDTINLNDPTFKSAKSVLIAVERSHQVIILQKFGLQVLFGCVRETGSASKLDQPKDIPDIVINIDMIERFRKVWNDANAPITYDQWVYSPSERKIFNAKSLANAYKDRFNEQKKDVGLNVSGQDITSQGSLALNTSTKVTSSDGKIDVNRNNTNTTSESDNILGKDKNTRSSGGLSNNVKDQKYPIKGEATQLGINQSTQFEIKSLVSKSKIKSLGVDYFTIQIAASKNHLITEKLKKDLYCSNYAIEEKNEDGWYKYLVGQFTSIDSAVKFLARPCFTQGFVSGYNTKGRVAIFSVKQPFVSSFDTSVYSVVYRVQIAASREPISNETLTAIYKGFNPVNVSREDGWYRYSVGDFIYYNEAKATRDSCGAKDAFVMPYHNQKRIHWPRKDLMDALKIKQNDNPIYVVQVAASRKPLSFQIIHDIIKIDYPLTMKFEDGWYKYYISAFTNFSAAKEVASKIGINGAFIATYKNGLRVKP